MEVERITWEGKLLACVVRAEAQVNRTEFLTPPEYNFQLGFVKHAAGGEITPHRHPLAERRIVSTFEVLLVREGRCEVDIYNDERERIATRELRAGDVLLITAGGHGYRMLEDTVLLELKQGPYAGPNEKEQLF